MDKNLERFKDFAPKNKSLINGQRTTAVIYTRVSTSRQETNTSLGTQLKDCEAYARSNNLTVVRYFGNTSESAKTDERKEFSQMLDFVRKNKTVGYIIVYSFDRFSRTGANGIVLTEKLKSQGIIVCSATQNVDYSTYVGEFQRDMLYIFGKMDNDIRRDKLIKGTRARLRKGYNSNGMTPYGYTNLNPGKGKVPNLIVNKQGELLREAFNLKVKYDLSYKEITERLKRKGWTKHPKKLSDYFRNPFYAGLIVSPLIPGEVIQGIHPPLVSDEMFLKINGILRKNEKGKKHSADEENLPLKQFVRSARDESYYTGYLVKKKGLYYYKNNVPGSCENVSAKKMHQLFAELLSQFHFAEPSYKEVLKVVMMETYSEMHSESLEEISELEKQLNAVSANIDKIDKRFALGEISEELYNKFKPDFEKELSKIEQNIQDCAFQLSNLERAIENAIRYAENLSEMWVSGDLEVKRRIQRMVFPEGLLYDTQTGNYRTTRINSLFAVIPEITKVLGDKKKGTKHNINALSLSVAPTGIEPISKV